MLFRSIDGHAKNFSIYLLPGGGFRMTPLYDVMSAYPLIAKKELHTKQMKMAMSIDSKNKHYYWQEIIKRHWSALARKPRFPETELPTVFQELLDNMDDVINRVVSSLPDDFPPSVSQPVFDGVLAGRAKLK